MEWECLSYIMVDNALQNIRAVTSLAAVTLTVVPFMNQLDKEAPSLLFVPTIAGCFHSRQSLLMRRHGRTRVKRDHVRLW